MANSRLDDTSAARVLAALGSAVRLRVYKALLRVGPEGTNVTDLQREVGMAPSTLAHHLSTLAEAGVVLQEKRGRELICSARVEEIRKVSGYLMDECCAGARAARCKAA